MFSLGFLRVVPLHLNYEFIMTGRPQLDSWRHLEGVDQKYYLQFTGHVKLWNLLHMPSIRKKLVSFWSNSLTFWVDLYVAKLLTLGKSLNVCSPRWFCLKVRLIIFETECDNVILSVNRLMLTHDRCSVKYYYYCFNIELWFC